jgi:uncharacterized protein (TIGR03067 family)
MLPTVFLALAVVAPALKEKSEAAPPSPVGTWIVETRDMGGKPQAVTVPETWIFYPDGSPTAGHRGTVTRRGTCVLDDKTSPTALDLTADPGNHRHLCIYRIEGDTLTLNSAGARPTGRPPSSPRSTPRVCSTPSTASGPTARGRDSGRPTTGGLIVSTVVLLAAALGVAAPAPEEKTGPKVGATAPDFTLKDQHGKDRALKELVKDGPVALVFHRSAAW